MHDQDENESSEQEKEWGFVEESNEEGQCVQGPSTWVAATTYKKKLPTKSIPYVILDGVSFPFYKKYNPLEVCSEEKNISKERTVWKSSSLLGDRGASCEN